MPQFPVKKRLDEPLQKLSTPLKGFSAFWRLTFSALSVLVRVFLFPREESSDADIKNFGRLDMSVPSFDVI